MTSPAAGLPRLRTRARPPRSMAIFATIALTLIVAVHATIWWRLVGAPGLGGAPQAVATAALGLCFASVPAALTSRAFGTSVPPLVTAVGFRWLGLVFYWFILSLAAEPIVQTLSWLAPGGAWPQAAAAGVAVVGVALSTYALAGARTPPIRRVDVPIPSLDRRLEGFRIAQLSDVHLGNTIGRDFIEAIVARTNAESVDLIALTGDLVDGTVAALGPSAAPFAGLRSRHGSYFVTGNHEYFSGASAWCAEFSRMGITVLRNEHRTLDHDGAGLIVAGVDDPFANEPGHGPDLAGALAGRAQDLPVVLLAHQPVFADQAAHVRVSLMLSGHTHGGQLWPFSLLVSAVQPILAGLVRVRDTWVYVSRGTGWWGPPMRLGAPNEITVLTLRRA